jgi:hypothetical protein
MLSTRTYDEFIAQVSALCMKDFSDKDEKRIATLGNLAAKRAYKESQWWERWLVASEPRSATRGRVDASEDSFYVFGAGTGDVNGLYVRNGTVNGKAAYTLYDTDGTTALYDIEWDNSTDWQILSAADAILYDITDSSTTPPLTGWASNTGDDPAPLLTDVADIDTYLTISSTDVIRDSASRPIRFYVDSSGANLRTNDAPTTVWVTYKKTFTDVYGNGEAGTVSTIPSEWFNYMTLYAAYMYQSSQRQNNGNQAYTLALREVENALQDELIRLEAQHVTDNLPKNVYTHLSQNQSLS